MMLTVHIVKPRLVDMCVDLSGREIGVTEHLLDGAQIGAILEQVRRKRVTQHVWRDFFRDAGIFRPSLNDLPKPLTAESTAASVQKQRLGFPTTEPVARLLDVPLHKILGNG